MNNISKKYLVVGSGITGYSVIKFLSKQSLEQDISIAVIDTRINPPNKDTIITSFPNVKFVENINLKNIKPELLQVDFIVVSPGIYLPDEFRNNASLLKAKIISDLDLFAEYVTAPVIGITGSNGKSTVTDLLGSVVKYCGINAAVGGNLGTPALDLLDNSVELYILELSSFQLEATNRLNLNIGVLLNVTNDHLDRHKTFVNYKNAKQKIYSLSKSILYSLEDINTHIDDACTSNRLQNSKHFFSLNHKNDLGLVIKDIMGEYFIFNEEKQILNLSNIKLIGIHNFLNVLAVFTISKLISLPLSKVASAISKYNGLEHRFEVLPSKNNINWVNDSKSTNIGSTVAAINSLGDSIISKFQNELTTKKILLVLGGDDKGDEFIDLINPITKHVKNIFIIGKTADKIQACLLESNKIDKSTLIRVNSLEEVVRKSLTLASEGDWVLLSPACSSFDMFANFADRGRIFKELVNGI